MKPFTTLALLALCALARADCPVYLPNSDDMVFMDAEQRGAGGGWDYFGNGAAGTQWGALGSGYLSYKQQSSFGGTERKPQNFADERIKTFYFTVATPGRYRVMLRSSAPDPTEHNDLWMSLPESGAMMTRDGYSLEYLASPVPANQMGADTVDDRTWFKVYQNQGGNAWNVGGFTTDFDPKSIIADNLRADQTWYSVRIAGRSTQFKVDRIIVFKCEDAECAYNGLRYGIAEAYTGPQNECGGF